MSRRILAVAINPGLSITGFFPDASVNSAYSATLTAFAGEALYEFSLVSGSLPTGLTFTDNGDGTATVSGTPTSAGPVSITVRLEDGTGKAVERTFTFRVVALPLSISGSFGNTTLGSPMADSLTVSGGVPPYTVVPGYTAPSGSVLEVSGSTVIDTGATDTVDTGQTYSGSVMDSEGATAAFSGSVDVAAYVDPYTTITELHFEGSEGASGPGAYTDDAPSPVTWGAANSNGLIAAAAVYEGTRGLNLATSRAIFQPSLAGSGNSGFNFGSDDFTIEVSIYIVTSPTAGNYRWIIAKDDVASTRGWLFNIDGDFSGHLRFSFRDGVTWYGLDSGSAFPTGVWRRVKVERVGNSMTLAIDSGSGYSTVDTLDVTGVSINSNSYPVCMGVSKNGGSVLPNTYHNGYMDYLLVRRKYP